MPPPLVIFDFDGTIADSGRSIALTAQIALASHGEAPIDDEAFTSRIGLPLGQIFSEVVPDLDPARCDALVATYRERFPEVSRLHSKLFEGIVEILHALRRAGSSLAIATGKSTSGAHHSIERLGLDPSLFARVVGTDGVPRPKPHPDMVQHIVRELGAASDTTCVVGDTSFDMAMGRAAGAHCVGVTWGSHSRATLEAAGASSIADTRAELRDILFASP